MRIMKPGFKLQTTIVILFLVSIEVVLRIFWQAGQHDPGDSKQQALDLALRQSADFYRERFCDSIHQNQKGEAHVARCVWSDLQKNKLSNEFDKILTLGASTTHGYNCESNTSWPKELLKLNQKLNIINLADDGAYSDESITKLRTEVADNRAPGIVIWSHGITEFLFYGDNRDINWNTLKQDQQLINVLQAEAPYKENIFLKIMRIDITLQKYSVLYRWLRVISNMAALTVQSGYLKFVLSISDDNGDSNIREKHIATAGFLNGPVRLLYSPAAQKYALRNYELNLENLKDISEKNSIKVLCIKIPYVRNLFTFFSKEFGAQYDAWIEKVNNLTASKCLELGFALADVDQCFLDASKNPQTQ